MYMEPGKKFGEKATNLFRISFQGGFFMRIRLMAGKSRFLIVAAFLAALSLLLPMTAFAQSAASSGMSSQGFYQQTNLVSNMAGEAPVIDPNLDNAWGLAAGPTTPWWV